MLNVLFDLGNTVLKFPAGGLESEGEFSLRRSSIFESLVRVTYDSLITSRIHIEWSSFFAAYKNVRAEQIKHQKQTLREYDMKERLVRVLEALGCKASPHSQVIQHALEDYFKAYTDHVTIEKGTQSLLENLHLERKLGLVTNFAYPPCIHKMLEKFDISIVFDAVVVSGEIGWVKPSPRIFNHALLLLKLDPSQVVFVGDDLETDIEGARNVGMKTILLSPERTSDHADRTIPHLSELPEVIKELEQTNMGQ